MIALSIRQPWAWLIINAGKDIENRSWPTRFRGRMLVHAGMTKSEYEELPRGGVIGSVEVVDCVSSHDSPWFFGKHGFLLRDPKPLPFLPSKGRLGFFDIPEIGA